MYLRCSGSCGTFSTTTYDLAGRKTAETDGEGKTTIFAYDSVGNLESVTDAMGHVTRYTYDANNNRITQTDANNHTTTMQYDKLNRLTQRTYPNGDNERFGYNENGNQIFKIDGEGDSTVCTYDNRNREVLKRFTNSGHVVETRYTDDGKPDTVVDHRGMTIYSYDNRGRQASVINPDNTFIESVYDFNGNRTEQRTSFDTVTYSYDVLNRMSTVSNVDGVTEYFYNEVGNRDSVHNANGTSTGYTYDDLNRLTKVTNYAPNQTVISSYEYELNNAGIRTSVTESDGSRVDYDYDDCYKLIGETRTGTHAYAITYTYDNVGNRLTQARDGAITSYTYNNRDQLTQKDSAAVITTYVYDLAGRMTSKTIAGNTTTYGWEDNDRIVSVTSPGVSVTYTYDHNEQRVSETSATDTTHYLIDYQLPYGQVIADFDENGDVKASYVYGLERISMDRNGTVFTYVADGQGSMRQLANQNGNVTDTYYYTAFGEQLAKTGTTVNRFMYVGEQWDVNAGFYYNRARWMDPSTGRFVSVDPYEGDPMSPVSLHRYLYANCSPQNYTDPTGKATFVEQQAAMSIQNILMTSFRVYNTAFNIIDKVNTALDIISAVRTVVGLFGAGAPAMVDVGRIVKEIAAAQAADFWLNAEQELNAQAGTIIQNVTLLKTKLMVKDAPKMKRPDFKFILYLPSTPTSTGPWMTFSSGIKINNKKVELYAGNMAGRLAGVGYSVGGSNNQLFRMDYHGQHGNSNTPQEWPSGIFHFHVDKPY